MPRQRRAHRTRRGGLPIKLALTLERAEVAQGTEHLWGLDALCGCRQRHPSEEIASTIEALSALLPSVEMKLGSILIRSNGSVRSCARPE